MVSERFDYVAFDKIGAYAICTDDGRAHSRKFVANALRRGSRIERMPVSEASALHMDYLRKTWTDPAGRAALVRQSQAGGET